MMVVAALRHAARRIGGGAMQRAQLPSFIHSGKPACSRTVSPTSAGRSGGDAKGLATTDGDQDFIERIKRYKEDFYSAFSLCQQRDLLHGTLARQNRQLLELLSVQVEPKHYDPIWRKHRRGKRLRDFMMLAGVFGPVYVVLGGVFYLFKEADPNQRNGIQGSLQ